MPWSHLCLLIEALLHTLTEHLDVLAVLRVQLRLRFPVQLSTLNPPVWADCDERLWGFIDNLSHSVERTEVGGLQSGFLYFRGIYFMGIVVHGIFVFFILTALRLEACSPDFCHPAWFWLPRDLASHGSTGPSLQFCMCDFYSAVFVSIYI